MVFGVFFVLFWVICCFRCYFGFWLLFLFVVCYLGVVGYYLGVVDCYLGVVGPLFGCCEHVIWMCGCIGLGLLFDLCLFCCVFIWLILLCAFVLCCLFGVCWCFFVCFGLYLDVLGDILLFGCCLGYLIVTCVFSLFLCFALLFWLRGVTFVVLGVLVCVICVCVLLCVCFGVIWVCGVLFGFVSY